MKQNSKRPRSNPFTPSFGTMPIETLESLVARDTQKAETDRQFQDWLLQENIPGPESHD